MVIQSFDQITPEWLTEKFSEGGILQQGRVTNLALDSQTFNRGYVSTIVTLRVDYSNDARGELPPSLVLKMSKPDVHPELLRRGCHEVKFYRAAAEISDALPIPQCYEAQCDEATYQSHILMQDLSATHLQQPLPLPPSNRHCEMIVASLAELHARWWNDPRLGVELGERLDEKRAAETHARLEATLPQFVDYLGDALLPQQRRAFEQIMASTFLQRLTQRLIKMQDVTLIHGDAHTGNLMLPRDTERERVILIDWQLWDINVAAIDLAFLIALHWSPPRRALLERPLLKQYYDTLSACGVKDYSWDDLWRDYRESVIIMTLIPIGQFRRGSPTGVIWFGLQDSMAAFEDLDCAELL